MTPNIKIWGGCYEGSLKGLITPASFSHPAKMSRLLTERIFDYGAEKGYWKPGQIIVDPFGGIFTTGIIGAYRNYQVIGVELEPRFVEMAAANIERNRRKLETLGRTIPVILQGDSRKLREIINGAVGVVTSPPYAESSMGGVQGGEGPNTKWRNGAMKSQKEIDSRALGDGYGQSPGQLGAMPEGDHAQVMGAITSPPFETQNDHERPLDKTRNKNGRHSISLPYGTSPEQIGTMPAGDHAQIVGAITSPPFAGNTQGKDFTTEGRAKLEAKWPGVAARHLGSVANEIAYGASDGQINAMPEGDAGQVVGAITSPPYADSLCTDSNGIDTSKLKSPRQYSAGSQAFNPVNYGYADGQMGAMDTATYWGAVAAVYQELYALLPSGGAAAIVVKAYVKNKKIVDLPGQTVELLQAIGFDVVEICRAMLVKETARPDLFGETQVKKVARKSFFRRLAESNGSPPIDWEEVIWAVKK